MSERLANWRKTTALASAGVPAIDSLPPELLETVFGFLDVGTLCTARLVCAQFYAVASPFLHSVKLSAETLRDRPEPTLANFPNLSRVTVFNVKEADLLMLTQHPLAHAVTHVRAVGCRRPVVRGGPIAAGAPLQPLPNMVSLTVRRGVNTIFPFPETLRELILKGSVSRQHANLVTGLTSLTCLRIKLCKEPNNVIIPMTALERLESFEGVAALTALQRLDICCHLSVIPFVAELTLLTHLQFRGKCGKSDDLRRSLWSFRGTRQFVSLAPLARLHRLVHLGFTAEAWNPSFSDMLESEVLACASAYTMLRSLDVGVGVCHPIYSAISPASMTPFSQLTVLRLRKHDSIGQDAFFLPEFKLKRLQDLSLSRGVELSREGVAALRKATGLTHLELWSTPVVQSSRWAPVDGSTGRDLEIALSHMSRLRSLSLGIPALDQASASHTWDAVHATFSLQAIALLTELTMLELRGRGVTTKADLEVCRSLKKLRVLRMEVDIDASTPAPSDRITRKTFYAVAKLPELRKFDIAGNLGGLGGNLADKVRARVHTKRHAKGWPPLEVNILTSLRSHKP